MTALIVGSDGCKLQPSGTEFIGLTEYPIETIPSTGAQTMLFLSV